MKSTASVVAVGCLALLLAAPAQAQVYYGGFYTPTYRGSIHNVQGLGYNTFMAGPLSLSNQGSYGKFYGGYHRPHIDYFPGRVVPHYNHSHYIPPHTDLHIGRKHYQVVPGPFGTIQVSPFPHRHR